MAKQKLLPQLVMMRPNLDNIEQINLPGGYALRSFQDGDEAAWNKIIAMSFDRPINTNEFDNAILQNPVFKPERVLFITHNGEPVATASAWHVEKWSDDVGYLHMVGVCPGHRGKRLGYWITIAILRQFVIDKRKSAVLETDDFRLAALALYLNLGFEPYLVDENQRERWQNIFKLLDRENLNEYFSKNLTKRITEK